MKRLLTVAVLAFTLLIVPQAAYAQTDTGTSTGTSTTTDTTGATAQATTPTATVDEGKCGDTKTQLISCDKDTKTGVGAISALIKVAITVMTVLIGIVATGGIAYAAILYASARDSQSQLDQSKTIIRNVVIGLFLYGFTIAIIGWLIPGSVIG